MKRRIGRRVRFFFLLAATSLVLVIPTPEKVRSVPWFAAGLSLLWAILFLIEDLSRGPREEAPDDEGAGTGDVVFAPPPHR